MCIETLAKTIVIPPCIYYDDYTYQKLQMAFYYYIQLYYTTHVQLYYITTHVRVLYYTHMLRYYFILYYMMWDR